MRELEFREIKFRAFDTENKTWTFVTLGDLICEACTKKGDKPLSGARQVWEQYTGLKDKNGKEIYEGDIVRIDSMDEIRVGYVELVADQYCIVCGEDEEGRKTVAEFYYYSKPEENCEIIGNIHENPELLGGKGEE